MIRKMVHAVLTGDIVNSTGLTGKNAEGLIASLEQAFGTNLFEFYRGDAFQVYVPDAGKALEMALLCRSLAIAVSGESSPGQSDIRIGIGIGEVETPVEKLGTARGEAFLLSGRGFDGLADSGARLIISVTEAWPALAFRILSDQINGIFSGITVRQAAVMVELFKGKTQRDAAELLGRSQSTIHQHLAAAGWAEIEKCIKHYRQGITLLNQ